jgi:alpha-1,6-mannosyltransferase
MLVCACAAALVAHRLLGGLAAVPDLRHHVDYAAGLKLPLPVVGSALDGWPVLGSVWALIAALGFCGWRFAASLPALPAQRLTPLIVAAQIAVGLCLSLFPLTLSGDPYAYVIWGRLYGVHGLNPYLLTHAIDASRDPSLAASLAFYGNPPPSDDHGPLWTLLAGMLSRLERGSSLWAQVWTHRLLSVAAAVCTSLALARILRKQAAPWRYRWVAAFAFSPLVLFETSVGGHNDMLMIALAAWAFALVDEYPLLAGALLGASIGVKYVSLLALPFLAARVWRRQGALAGVLAALVAPSVFALTFRPFWLGTATLYALVGHGGVFAMSPSWLANYYFFAHHMAAVPAAPHAAALPLLGALVWPRAVQLLLFAAFLSLAAWAWLRYTHDLRVCRLWTALSAFIWASPIIHPWYVLWLSPAIACGGRWAVFAWWFGLLIAARYVLDVSYTFVVHFWVLAALTLLFLFAPVVIARRAVPAQPGPAAAHGCGTPT